MASIYRKRETGPAPMQRASNPAASQSERSTGQPPHQSRRTQDPRAPPRAQQLSPPESQSASPPEQLSALPLQAPPRSHATYAPRPTRAAPRQQTRTCPVQASSVPYQRTCPPATPTQFCALSCLPLLLVPGVAHPARTPTVLQTFELIQ